MQIIFANTRYIYDSYSDFRRLIDSSGFSTCYIDEIRLRRPAIYIVAPINGEFRPHIENELQGIGENKRAKVVFWNLERPVEVNWEDLADIRRPVFACSKQSFDSLPQYVDKVWISDRLFAESLQNERVQFVPMGSNKWLGDNSYRASPIYDFAHMSYLSPRRESIHVQLAAAGLVAAPNAWPPQREEILAQSKIFLNIHQSDHLIGEPLRFAVAAATKTPLISETIADPYPMQPFVHYSSADYGNLAMATRDCLSNLGVMRDCANALYELFCVDYTFRRNVEDGIDKL